jgi:hypothetical protein
MRRALHLGGRAVTPVCAVAVIAITALMLVPPAVAGATQMSAPGGSHDGQALASTGSGTLFGSSVSDLANLRTETAEFGHMPIIHFYYVGLPPANAWSGLGTANHSAIVVSFGGSPSAVLSGAADPAIAHFFDTAPRTFPIYYCYFHEPENNIADGQFTAATYRAAWARVAQLADAAHNPDLHSNLILMGWDVNPYSHRNWRNYLPTGGIISVVSWDVFPGGGYGVAPPSEWMGPEIKVSRAAGLRFGFAEFATTTVRGRPAWLTSIGSYCRSTGAVYCTYFNSAQVGGLAQHGGSYIMSDQASITAWRQVVQGS